MADILIRKLTPEAKSRLERRAKRHGRSLEAELCATLERLVREEPPEPDSDPPFGTWLAAISRPGADLGDVLGLLRSAPPCEVDLG